MPGKQPSSAGRRITVVNTNAALLELIGDLLTDNNYAVSLIKGEDLESIEPIRAAEPDLLIVDLRMEPAPLSGWDILTAVRADDQLRDLPVLICTADTSGLEELSNELTKDRRAATLIKPFAIQDLENAVRGLLH